MSQRTKSVFDDNQDSYGIKTSSNEAQCKYGEVLEHVHDENEEICRKCHDHKTCEEKKHGGEDSESSEMDDDYDPDAAGNSKAPLVSKQSSIRLQKKKTVVFPVKMTKSEK